MDAKAYLLAGSPTLELVVIREAVSQLELGLVKFSTIVASINDYILSDNVTHQTKVLEYMAAVLATTSPDFLSRHDISLMVSYYLARLEILGAPGLKETAAGLRALASMPRFDDNSASDVCVKIFLREDFKSEDGDSRLEIYKLFEALLEKYGISIMAMGDEYITGLLTLASQERHPRCLMLVFPIIRAILADWNIKTCVQQLWDFISQYYPISYYVKPGDPTAITSEELKGELRLCIAATSEFAPLAFEFLISKLDTQVSAEVKRDVLETLAACISTYKQKDVAQYAVELWDSLKYEVLNSVDEDIASEVCLVLGGMSRALSFDLTIQAMEGTPLMVFIFAVIEECNRKIQDAQQRNIKQAMEIVFYVASASPFAFHLVLKGVLPPLQTVLSDTDAINKKRELLRVIHRLLDARIVLVENQYESGFPALSIIDGVCESVPFGTLGSGGLSFFRDDLFEIFAVALTRTSSREPSLRIVAVQGLVKLVMLPSLLAPGEVGMIIQYLNDLVLDMEDLGDELKEHAILGLRDIGRHYPQHIADVTFPAFLSTVPDNLSDDEDDGTYFPVLRALAKIASPVRMLYGLFNRRLLVKLDAVILYGRSQKLAHTVLSALLIGIKQSTIVRGETDLEYRDSRDVVLYQGLVEALYRRVTVLRTRDQGPLTGQQYVSLRMLNMMLDRDSAKLKVPKEPKAIMESKMVVESKESEGCSISAESGYTFVEPDDFMLELIGNIALVATRAMTAQEQMWAAKEIFTLFMRTDNLTEKYSECSISENGGDSTETIDIFYDSNAELRNIQTSLVDAPLDQKRTLVLSMHLMCGLYPDVSLNFDFSKVCTEMIRCVHKSFENPKSILTATISMICFLINKFGATGAGIPAHPNEVMPLSVLKDLVTHVGLMSPREAKNILHMAAIVTKAVNMKGDRSATELLNLLMDRLDHPVYGSYLAKEFEHVLGQHEHVDASNFIVIRPLYKQRPYAVCFTQLTKSFRSCVNPTIRANYLVALANLLRYTPSETIMTDADKILPLMLQSISAFGASVKSASIKVIHEITLGAPNAAEEHIRSIVHQLLERIHNTLEDPSDAPSSIRGLALNCLAAIPTSLQNRVTFPYKLEVLKELKIAADDVKRSVREDTVPCYTAWFSIADPDTSSGSL